MQATETLDKLASTPIYVQLRDLLRQQVAAGELAPGMRVPSERELAERWGISRMTARAALSQLVDLGHLRRVPGKGTFVERPKMLQGLQTLTSFTEDMRARGKVPGGRVLEQTILKAPPGVAAHLDIPPGTRVVKVRRVRLADNEPMSVETAFLPASRFAWLTREDLATQSLYAVLARQGVELAWSDQTVESSLARKTEALLLGIARRAPVLRIQRTTFDTAGQPVEHVRSVYRADRYTFRVALVRKR
ncbi:MAG: GntR family transcriptional regulator [Armatimonadota bacterium]|nr:GntR family transcriptional regulator [Armatimonadota bacterium]MDR7549227.1 GntR family transcriptional regulator [Armatimonadota bacterium]